MRHRIHPSKTNHLCFSQKDSHPCNRKICCSKAGSRFSIIQAHTSVRKEILPLSFFVFRFFHFLGS